MQCANLDLCCANKRKLDYLLWIALRVHRDQADCALASGFARDRGLVRSLATLISLLAFAA